MRFFPFILLILFMGCSSEKKEETIDREIKLKEVRKGHEVIKLTINHQITVQDTSEIYYSADIKINAKDSSISDSIFLIKGADGILLPFSTKNP